MRLLDAASRNYAIHYEACLLQCDCVQGGHAGRQLPSEVPLVRSLHGAALLVIFEEWRFGIAELPCVETHLRTTGKRKKEGRKKGGEVTPIKFQTSMLTRKDHCP